MLVAFVILLTLRRYRRAVASVKWPQTMGVIDAMDDYAHTSDEGSISWSYLCRYTYSVDGKTYKSYTSQLKGMPQFVNSTQRDHLISSNKPGTPLQVYYNPVSPHEAVLVPGKSKPLLMQLILLILVLIALLAATVAFSNNSQPIEIKDGSDVLACKNICKQDSTA